MVDYVVIGLDGAGFRLLEPWLSDGTLPNLAALRRRGVWSPLRVELPPVTCPNWRCYSTGVNPGKHGVFWWEQIDRETETFTVPSSLDFDAPDVWDYLSDHGLESAIINMPTTYPPEPLKGTIVSGGFDGGEYTYPQEFREEIENQFDYRVFLNVTSRNINEHEGALEDVLDLIKTRFQVAEHIRDTEDPDFLHVTVFYSNVFHHHYWDDPVTKRVWQHIDSCLGEFLRDDENVILMSDHGSNPIQDVFHINTWLEQEGFLETDRTVSDGLHRVGLTKERLALLADRLGVKSALKQSVPEWLQNVFPHSGGGVKGSGKANKINWNRSRAIASGQGPIYIIDDERPEETKRELRERLSSLSTPDGRPIARSVSPGADIYDGPYVDSGPDLIIDQADNVYISGDLGNTLTFDSPGQWRAENHRDGMFVAAGPNIASHGELNRHPAIYDLVPTILHGYGLPVPKQLEGTVRENVFAANTEPANRPVERTDWSGLSGGTEDSPVDKEQMRERLADLGYLGE